MSDVLNRVRAMSVVTEMWPAKPSPGSGFAADAELAPFSTYTVARVLLVGGLDSLQAAARLGQDPRAAGQGMHVLLLRPAVVSTAKAAWLVAPDDATDRVSRTARVLAEDRRQGARAMERAVAAGAPDAFEAVGDMFTRARSRLLAVAGHLSMHAEKRPPKDEALIHELGQSVDRYYGTADAVADLQLLWNTSSSLAHGERWYSTLTSGSRRARVAETLATRSFDVVCSGINFTFLRIMTLCATPAPTEAKENRGVDSAGPDTGRRAGGRQPG